MSGLPPPCSIRRRIQSISSETARSFLVRQRQRQLSEQLLAEKESLPTAESPLMTQPAMSSVSLIDELTQYLEAYPPATPGDLDRLWGRILKAMAAGLITPADSRRLSRTLGRFRNSWLKTFSDAGSRKAAIYK
ncbi:MAG: hypothetical protein HQL73_01565 [Magnetococcales bacterium]|nr:hypothetical protein [Magnetococcales bacterium]